jgi:hypothetical protein
MTTVVSHVPAVIDYLVTTCQASSALGAATPPVEVIDGPNVTADLLVSQRLLWIGYDALNSALEDATSALDWPFMDFARTVDEDGEVVCTAEFWSGDTVMKTVRDVTAVGALLRGTAASAGPGDTTMGGLVFWSRITSTAWGQWQKSDGADVICVFKIVYKSRLLVA